MDPAYERLLSTLEADSSDHSIYRATNLTWELLSAGNAASPAALLVIASLCTRAARCVEGSTSDADFAGDVIRELRREVRAVAVVAGSGPVSPTKLIKALDHAARTCLRWVD